MEKIEAQLEYPTAIVDDIRTYIKDEYKIDKGVDFSSILKELGNTVGNHSQNGKYGKIDLPGEPLTGIDIPVLVKHPKSKGPRPIIAIIAQDPLRNKNDERLPPNLQGNAIIGTPFALHYKEECYPQTAVYRRIIGDLLSFGDVYITDARKIYPIKKGLKEKDIDFLGKEISHIQPRLAITFGSGAKEYFDRINNKPDVINLLHPGKQNWDHWKQWIFEQAFSEAFNQKVAGFYTGIIAEFGITIRKMMFEDQQAEMPSIITRVVHELVERQSKLISVK